jgi:hypothetical protein
MIADTVSNDFLCAHDSLANALKQHSFQSVSVHLVVIPTEENDEW